MAGAGAGFDQRPLSSALDQERGDNAGHALKAEVERVDLHATKCGPRSAHDFQALLENLLLSHADELGLRLVDPLLLHGVFRRPIDLVKHTKLTG